MKPLAVLLALVFVPSAAAQDAPRDPFKDFRVGDRVEVQLRNGFTITGQILSNDPKVTTLEKMQVIILDIGWEYPELRGHVGVERIHTKSVKKLPKLSADELEARDKARQAALRRMEEEDAARRSRMVERELEAEKARREAEKKEKLEKSKGLGADLEAKAGMLKKGAELFAKFPPSEGWGQDKIKAISMKAVARVPTTNDEREFAENFTVWFEYKKYLEDEALKAKEKEAVEVPKPEVKKEEPPKP
jgi:hypothetical protein